MFASIGAGIVGLILKLAGSSVVDKVLGALAQRADNETKRQQIEATREATIAGYSRDVVVAGMAHRMFWVAWSIAAIPLAAWFGLGMIDTLLNGAGPDVAIITPGLRPFADIVWQNIFYSGAGVAGATVIGKSIAGAIAARRK